MHFGDTVSVDLIMDGWDHLALWVGVFAALMGAFAAIAAWRTVVVSERQQAADREERRIAQALLIYGELIVTGPQVVLDVTNASSYPISDVGGSWRRQGEEVSTIGGQVVIPAGETLRFNPQMATFHALYEEARYEIRYTDVAGVKWKRLDMERPTEVGGEAPRS